MGVFFDIFYKIYPKYKEGNHFRESDGSALMSLRMYFLGMDTMIINLLRCHRMKIGLKLNVCVNFWGLQPSNQDCI
jgi:hypothetical protein